MTPLLAWIDARQRMDVRADLIAGLTTGVMLVPQAMAYAMLAGLPPIVGLYASTLPLVVYALFGSSRALAIGPAAMDSLLVASALAPLAAAGSGRYVELAMMLALLLGALQLCLWMFRAGRLLARLPQSVLGGFTSAAAIVIALTQLGPLLGLSLPRHTRVLPGVLAAAERITDVHVPTLLLSAGSVAVLVGLKRFAPRVPRALVVVTLATLVVWHTGLASAGVAVVGAVPAGLPQLAVPRFDLAQWGALLPSALLLAVVGSVEAASVARAIAASRGERLSSNRELLGLGLANLSAAFVGGYAVTASFSRTAVNAHAGARSKWAGVVTAGVIVATLQWWTGCLYHLPLAALASIIAVAVVSLVDLRAAKRLLASSRTDFGLWLVSFVGTLALGVASGIAVGITASILLFAARRIRNLRTRSS